MDLGLHDNTTYSGNGTSLSCDYCRAGYFTRTRAVLITLLLHGHNDKHLNFTKQAHAALPT